MFKINYLKILMLSVVVLVSTSSLLAQDKQYQVSCVGFYNVENLFDIYDDPTIRDEEYTPEGRNNWDQKKYDEKLKNLSKVIADMGTDVSPDGCVILGVCEVENKKVLTDLVATEKLKDRNYKIVHFDSPDKRGIDVGLLYQEKYFKVTNSASYEVKFSNGSNYPTRDQLVVTGILNGEEVSVLVAHWPSRRGGSSASEPNRIDAARVGRHIVDSLYAINPNAKILYMGDLNDDPVNKSVKDVMNAKGKVSKVKTKMFFNPMWAPFKQGNGTLAYNDAWNLFDQILVSKGFLNDKDYSSLSYYKMSVYRKPFLFQHGGRYDGYPYRTRAGGKYLGGYSDHLPVFITLIKEVK